VHVISLGFQTDLMVRTLEGSEVVDHPDYVTVRSPANPEFWWGNFLLLPAAAAHGPAEPWLDLFRTELPGAGHLALGLDGTGVPEPDFGSFAAAGLELVEENVLTASALREPPRPDRDAMIRPLAGDQDWQQAVELQASCDARTVVIVADPTEAAIRVYRSVGFADHETQLSMHRLRLALNAAAGGRAAGTR
jgi:hypothetical protein